MRVFFHLPKGINCQRELIKAKNKMIGAVISAESLLSQTDKGVFSSPNKIIIKRKGIINTQSGWH